MTHLICSTKDQVTTLTLNRPEKKNALSVELIKDLHNKLEEIASDGAIKAVILTGAGNDFCSGGDLAELSAKDISIEYQTASMHHACALSRTLASLPKPVIAATEGVVFGAGFSIALAADFIIAAENTSFCMAFGRMGLIPDLGASYLLTRTLGFARARELILTTRVMDSAEALGLGMILERTEIGMTLARSEEIARNLCDLSPNAFAISKKMLSQAANHDLETILNAEFVAQPLALQSQYFQEAAQRFLHKQPPQFNWS